MHDASNAQNFRPGHRNTVRRDRISTVADPRTFVPGIRESFTRVPVTTLTVPWIHDDQDSRVNAAAKIISRDMYY